MIFSSRLELRGLFSCVGRRVRVPRHLIGFIFYHGDFSMVY